MLDVMPEMEAKSRVYLDSNATTGLSPELMVEIPQFLSSYGNPSSIHWESRAPKTILRQTRADLAKSLNCNPLELIFNSGGSEGNNTVLKSVFELSSRTEFITSMVEHPSVFKTFKYLETLGAKVHYVPVSRSGEFDLVFFEKCLSEKTALVSVMLANNETGSVFPIQEISRRAKEVGALVHSDCVQGLGKIQINLQELGVDYATFSAHKFYALKGTGVLYVKRGSPYLPLIHGGAQERSRRGGTENTLGLFALGYQVQKLNMVEAEAARLKKLRDHFESRVLNEIADVSITCRESARLPNTSSLILNGVDGETLLMSLDLKGFAVSTGAACSSGSPEPSPVLLALGLSRQEAQNSLRVSLSWRTTNEEIESFIETLKECVLRLRKIGQDKGINANAT